jgi:hemerythrin-like domain-containing protein
MAVFRIVRRRDLDLDQGGWIGRVLLSAKSARSSWMIGSERQKPDVKWLRRNALDLIEHEHRIQAQLCDSLERIADGLPNDVDCRLCVQVVNALRYEIPLHHRDEECGLFPLIERRALPGDNIHDILARLALEHATDESFASELLESLEALSDGETVKNPDMVGYMLRSFFESYRRHIHWENAIVLPLARARLTHEDIEELEQAMSRHREPGSSDGETLN